MPSRQGVPSQHFVPASPLMRLRDSKVLPTFEKLREKQKLVKTQQQSYVDRIKFRNFKMGFIEITVGKINSPDVFYFVPVHENYDVYKKQVREMNEFFNLKEERSVRICSIAFQTKDYVMSHH